MQTSAILDDVGPRPAWDESRRLAALASYAILDTPREPEFDDIVRLAADIFDAPIAVVNLLAEGRQWFKAQIGIEGDAPALKDSLCAHAIRHHGIVVIPDTRLDRAFAENPLVTGDPAFRFYAGAVLETPDGLPLGAVCVLDHHPRPAGITERQRLTLEVLARQVMTQLELRRAMVQRDREVERARTDEARLRLIVDGARDYAIITMDCDRRVTDWSRGAELVLGHSAADMLGRSVDEIFTPEDRAIGRPEHETGTAADQGCAPDERWHVRADGGRVFLNGSMHPLPRDAEGRKQGFIKIARDETTQRATSNALTESEARFRNMADHAPVMMWVTDASGYCTYLNRRWHEFTGQTEVEAQGYGWLDATHPDDMAAANVAFARANETQSEFRIEYRLRATDGSYRWAIDAASPRFDDRGEFLGYVGSVTDIHDRREAEHTLRDLADTLETRVEERTEELRVAEEQLRQAQKMEAVGQLTGGIAHDFNNLLTGVIGSLDLMQRKLAAGRGAEIDRHVSAAITSANRAAALTHRLLAFSRRQPLDPRTVDADDLIASMEELLRRTLGESVELESAPAEALWRTLCDPHQLESAILNLAINARDAMPDGGRLTIETSNAQLDRADVGRNPDIRPGQYVCIAVSDTGTGMTPDTIEKAFEPFFTTKPLGQGTGLGLSMIYGFARQSDGYAKIYSEPGQGTSVKLYLPRSLAGDEPDVVEPVRELREVARGEIVLVVEDETAVRDLVVEVLGDLGYHAIEAHDGPSGLRILRSDQPIDLLVTDVGLPGLNGRQLADAARETRPALKILFMTGYAADAAANGGFLAPGMELLTKPFSIDALADRLRTMLERG